MKNPTSAIKRNQNFFFCGIIVVSFLLFFHAGTANAINYKAKTTSLTMAGYNNVIGISSAAWNGTEYKMAYMTGEGPKTPEIGFPQHRIELSTVDKDGNILETKSLIENPQYSAQNPHLIFTGIDYILLWVEADPKQYFRKLHGSIIDENGNIVSDKVISSYIPGAWLHPYTQEYGTYSASWDSEEGILYLVYAEENSRIKYSEELVFRKLYKTAYSLDILTINDGYKLAAKKLLSKASTVYNRISLAKAPNNLVIAASTNYGSTVPFLLTDLDGNILEESNIIFDPNDDWPTLYYDGKDIILGSIHNFFDNNGPQYNYQIKKIEINNENNGFDLLFVKKSVTIDGISPSMWPVLLRKDNGHLTIVWKDEINSKKAFHVTGFDKNLNLLLPIQALEPPYNVVDLNDYWLTDGIGNDIEFALLFTRKYVYKEVYILRFNIYPILTTLTKETFKISAEKIKYYEF